LFKKLAAGPRAIRLLGYGHTTDYLPLEKKDVPEFSIARRAAAKAYSMSGLKPSELHRCGSALIVFPSQKLSLTKFLVLLKMARAPQLL